MELYSFDDQYLQRLRAGDATVEAHFIAYFSKMLVIKLRSRLRSTEAVEDVKQETFFRVFRTLRAEEGIRSAVRLGSFVNSVCNFVLMEHYRAGRREDSIEDHVLDPPDHTVDMHGELVTAEDSKSVRTVLSKLEQKDRELLTAIFLDERDKDDVCREFHVDRGYLRVLLYRAKKQFRDRYDRKN